jgi:hypothetical protein
VTSSGNPELSPEDLELIELVAEKVVSSRMTVPAILFVESSKPLSFIGSQFMYFLEPIVRAFIKGDRYTRFAALLEDRENVEVLLQAIEYRESIVQDRERLAKKAEKERKAEEKARRKSIKEERKP